MSAIRQANSKSLMLFSGRAYPELATEIAAGRIAREPDRSIPTTLDQYTALRAHYAGTS